MKKKQTKITTDVVQKFPNGNKPPIELAKLIDIFRLIKPNTEIPNFNDIFEFIRDRRRTKTVGDEPIISVGTPGLKFKKICGRNYFYWDWWAIRAAWRWTLVRSRNSDQWGVKDLIAYILNILPQELERKEVDAYKLLIEYTYQYDIVRKIIKGKDYLINQPKNKEQAKYKYPLEMEKTLSRLRELMPINIDHPDQNFLNVESEYKALSLEGTGAILKIVSHVSLTDDGRLNFRNSPIIELLKIIKIDRLRICEICNHIYWAYRLNAQTCSIKCADARRQRNYRKSKGGTNDTL
jgi:hypothetical protein